MMVLNNTTTRRHALRIVAISASAWSFTSIASAASSSIGLSLPLTGVQAETAAELLAGYQLAIDAQGSPLSLTVLDDASDAKRTAENVKKLASMTSIVALSGIVGTPHALAALPLAAEFSLPVVGIRSGALALRGTDDNVFHLRASFEDELDKMVRMCTGAGFKRLSVLYSNDAFGIGSKNHLVERLAAAGVEVGAVASVERDGSNLEQATLQIAQKIKSDRVASAIALLLIAKPMVAAATSLRETHVILVPLLAMSFVANRQVASAPSKTLSGLGLVIAFPLPRSSTTGLATKFRADAIRMGKPELIDSLASFEAYFYGSIIARAFVPGMNRKDFAKRVQAGVQFAGTDVQFNAKNVGYNYLEIVYKAGVDGKLRA